MKRGELGLVWPLLTQIHVKTFPESGAQLFQREIGLDKYFQDWSGWSALFVDTNTVAPQNW